MFDAEENYLKLESINLKITILKKNDYRPTESLQLNLQNNLYQ